MPDVRQAPSITRALSSRRFPRLVVLANALVLVTITMSEPRVPRAESRTYRYREAESGFQPGHEGYVFAISQQPLGTAFVAERLWHPFYFPGWFKALTVLEAPSIAATVVVATIGYVPLQASPPWLRSWLNAAIFLVLSSAQWLLLARAFRFIATRVRRVPTTATPA